MLRSQSLTFLDHPDVPIPACRPTLVHTANHSCAVIAHFFQEENDKEFVKPMEDGDNCFMLF